MYQLEGKVAVVSGASKGMGFETAKQMAAAGVRVMMVARGEEALAAAAEELTSAGSDVRYAVADMAVKDQVERVVARTVQELGGLNIAVTNVYPLKSTPFSGTTDDDFRTDFEALLMSSVYVARAVSPHLIAAGYGRIINIGSISMKGPFRAFPAHLPSNSIRPAVAGLNKSLAYELAPHGITVNNIGVGFIKTSRFMDVFKDTGKTAEEIEAEKVQQLGIPLGRLGLPEEVGALATFLASVGASYITGQTIAIDGGLMDGLY
jgi:3-oxoacyl-[acyl-carrier protein] reductase